MIFRNCRISAVTLLILMYLVSGCSNGMKPQFNTAHFSFIYNSQYDASEAKKVANTLEDNYSRISNDLNTMPVQPIEVYLYSNRWTYATTHGHWTSGGNIEGDGKLHFLQHGWDESSIENIAVHEFSHAVMLKLLIDQEPLPIDTPAFDKKFVKFPTWFYESIAVYEAKQFIDPATLPFLANNQYPNLEELNTRSKGQKVYKVGFTIIEYILATYGKTGFLQLVKSYGDLRVLNTTPESFSKNWYAFVKQKYFVRK